MKPLFRVLVFTALCTAPIIATQAFWSRYGFKIHQQVITARALGRKFAFNAADPVSGNTANYLESFDPSAVDAINETIGAMDDPSAYAYLPIDHFDAESLEPGFRFLAQNRNNLMSDLAVPSPDQSEVWALLGQMLHQIQDFYPHTSWVANYPGVIVNFGLKTENWDPTGVPPYPFNVGSIPIPSATSIPVISAMRLVRRCWSL